MKCQHRRKVKGWVQTRQCGLTICAESKTLCFMHYFWANLNKRRHGKPALRRFDVAPIQQRVRLLERHGKSLGEIADRVGVNLREVHRLLARDNDLLEEAAERWAIGLGLHPENIWPFEWTSLEEAV